MPRKYKPRSRGKRRRLTALKTRSDDSSKELINEIKYAEKENNFDKALKLLDDYLYENPNDYYMIIYKGNIMCKQGRTEPAQKIFLEILGINNLTNRERTYAILKYAKSLKIEGKYEEAIHYYEEGINNSDEYELVSRAELSRIYFKNGQKEDAISILEIDGFNNMYLNTERAKIYYFQGFYDKALGELDKPEINDEKVDIKENLDDNFIRQNMLNLKGHILYKKKKYEEAYEILNSSLISKKSKVYVLSIIDMAKIETIKGNVDQAIAMLEDLLKNEMVTTLTLSMVKGALSYAYQKSNKYEKALALYDESNINEKDCCDLVKIYITMGNFKKADELLKQFDFDNISIEKYFDAYFLYLKVKFRLGEYDILLKYLDKIEEYNRQNPMDMNVESFMDDVKKMRIIASMNLNIPLDYTNYSYSEEQILNYDEQKAIEHIISHHVESPLYNDFYDGIIIEDLYYKIKDELDSSVVYYDTICDRHVFSYSGIGYDNKGSIDELVVITIPNTNNIITMYPTKGYKVGEVDRPLSNKKRKRLSQSEKFKQKWGIE